MTNVNTQKIYRIIALLLVVACIASVSVITVSAESGTCGDKLNWSYSFGTLLITGEGDMYNYNEFETAPWYSFRSEIKKLVISDGITSIGSLAFYGCTAIRTVDIPDTVRTIGTSAFFGCTGLELVDLSAKLSRIGNKAFYGCIALSSIPLPISLESIGDKAFYLCESLVSVTVPRYAERWGNQIFAYCVSLLRVQIDAYIKEIPEWTFYGCENLSEIALPPTVTSIEEYALKRCDNLTGIYHSGNSETLDNIRDDIAESNPNFAASGYIGNGTISGTTNSTDSVYNTDDKLVSQTNTSVTVQDGVTVVTKVENKPNENGGAGSYNTDITVSVENGSSWDTAADTVADALNGVNDRYSQKNKSEGTTVTVYTNDTTSVGEDFFNEMAGRDVVVEVVTPGGNIWRVDCSELKDDSVSGDIDYGYTVGEASKESAESLGTNDCFGLGFSQSTSLKSEVIIQLPSDAAGKNAFLYQIEEDGTHKKLQTVVVDKNANAHFFLSNVEKDTQYVIGMNVPGEPTDDVIIPNELSPVYGAILRLENIEYVSTGVRTVNGLTLGNLLLIVIGILVFLTVVIGGFMFYNNRKKLQKSRKKA